MTGTPKPSSLDRFVSGSAVQLLAFVWGLAEATVFFIVPDVLLTLMACREFKPAVKATVAALIGAMIGGAVMYWFGSFFPNDAPAVLDRVPAINADLVAGVRSQIESQGLAAVLFGPVKGIPYKIYAVEWGAKGGSLAPFLFISVPARWIRFFLAAAVVRGITVAISPVTLRYRDLEVVLLGVFWIAFYSFYFARFGW